MRNLLNHNDWRETGSYSSKGSAQGYLNSLQAAGSSRCGSACGAGNPDQPKPSACGAGDDPKPKTGACGSACGAGGK